MGLRALVERRASQATPERYLQEMVFQRSGVSNVPATVDESQALTHSAVWAGAFLYADLISTLPFAAYRDVDGAPVKLPSQPQILTAPAVSVPAIDWRAQVVISAILRGNAWGLILTRDQYAYPTTIELQHPDCVTAKWDDEKLRMTVKIDGVEVNPADVWHFAINVLPGCPFGLSMVSKARQSIYGGVAAQAYGNEFFASGGHPTAILKPEQSVDSDQATALQDRYDQRRGERGGRAIVMQGIEYVPIQVSPEDTQFLDAIKASVADVARFLRLPPEMIGGESGSSMTYSNVESRAVDLLRYSIDPILVRLESALTGALPNPQYVKATRAALLRMTTKERYEAHQIALSNGWENVNEVRALEELPPIPEGDTYMTPSAPVAPVPAPNDGAPANG